jgi:mRNA-degrading endonuclease RelE of RelBE toxin-antitoxin system
MTNVVWDPKARDFLRKLPKKIAERLYGKVDNEIEVMLGDILKY